MNKPEKSKKSEDAKKKHKQYNLQSWSARLKEEMTKMEEVLTVIDKEIL